MPALGVTADVWDVGPMSIKDLESVEYTIGAGSHGIIDEAYWDVSVFLVQSTFPYPGRLEITSKWVEIDDKGNRSLHYIVRNRTPSPLTVTYCTFIRRLVRIPAR